MKGNRYTHHLLVRAKSRCRVTTMGKRVGTAGNSKSFYVEVPDYDFRSNHLNS